MRVGRQLGRGALASLLVLLLPALCASLEGCSDTGGGGSNDGSSNGDGSGSNSDGGSSDDPSGRGTSTITGMIIDADEPHSPIADAYVYVPISAGRRGLGSAARQTEAVSSTSASDGSYTLTGVNDGAQTIIVRAPAGTGFAEISITINVPESVTVTLQIALLRETFVGRIGKVVLDPSDVRVQPDGTVLFETTVFDQTGAPLPGLLPTYYATHQVGAFPSGRPWGTFAAATLPTGENERQGTVVAMVGSMDYVDEATITVRRENTAPATTGITAEPNPVQAGHNVRLTCQGADADEDSLTYEWVYADGTLSGSGPQVTWTSPMDPGDYGISCIVDDGFPGGRSEDAVVVTVVEPPPDNEAPAISSLTADASSILVRHSTVLHCSAADPDEGDVLAYDWETTVGEISGSGATVTFTAPEQPGSATITCTVSDGPLSDSDTVDVLVKSSNGTVALGAAGYMGVESAPEVTVVDHDLDGLGSVSVTVHSVATDSVGETITLTETDSPGTFTGAFGFERPFDQTRVTPIVAANGDVGVYAEGGVISEVVAVEYADEMDASGDRTTRTDTATYEEPSSTLTGIVRDRNTRLPIADAVVEIDELGWQAMTRAGAPYTGHFAFYDVPSGTYTLVIAVDGYVIETRISVVVP